MAKQWEAFKAGGTVFAKTTGLKAPGVLRNLCGQLLVSEQEYVNTPGSGEVLWELHPEAFAPRDVTLRESPQTRKQGCAMCRA